MLIAITGATGFLGRYIVRRLARAGHRMRCWHRPASDRSGFDDVLAAGAKESIEAINQKLGTVFGAIFAAHVRDSIEWLPGQLGDADATTALIRGADAVVHGAVDWAGARNRQREQVDPFIQQNLVGSLQLFQAAFAAGMPRFIHISTCAVHEVILDDRPLDEAHPLWPSSHYGAHKAALEKFVHSYGLGHGWPICALRPTGIYGVAHPPSKSRWYDLVGQVLRGEPIQSAAGGKEVHAADVANAVELLLRADAKTIAGQAYNCYDRYIAEQEVAGIAKELTGSKSTIANVNKGPKHQIVNEKIRRLGMTFGGEALLRQTVQELVQSIRT